MVEITINTLHSITSNGNIQVLVELYDTLIYIYRYLPNKMWPRLMFINEHTTQEIR